LNDDDDVLNLRYAACMQTSAASAKRNLDIELHPLTTARKMTDVDLETYHPDRSAAIHSALRTHETTREIQLADDCGVG
jgi:hypothetical protein